MKDIKTGFGNLLSQTPVTEPEKDSYIIELKKAVELLVCEVRNLDEAVALLRKKQFGASSEKTKEEPELGEFNEAEREFKVDAEEPLKKDKRGYHFKNAMDQWKLYNNIDFSEILLDIEKSHRICKYCGEEMEPIGREIIREVPEFIPAKLRVVRYVQIAYSCKACKKNGHFYVIKRPAPAPLLNHSMASSSVVAQVIYQKYVQAVPLYRQEKDWESLGVKFSRTTMANWIIRCSEDWLSKAWDALRKELLTREVLHADETSVQVLHENGKPATSKSYMWLYCTSSSDKKPIVLYDYQPGRGGEYPKKFLNGFSGYLHTDGYAGYNQLTGITRCGCWAHLRRKFVEAMPVNAQAILSSTSPAQIGRDYCNQLFAAETSLALLPAKERQKQRLEVQAPMLKAFWCWLDELSTKSLGGNLKKAVVYAQNQRPFMENYLNDPRCQISNNQAENAIRPFTVGRKNWLFSDSVSGAKASAVIYSLVETAKANNLAPKDYIEILLNWLPDMNLGQQPENINRIFPWSDGIKEAFDITDEE